MMDACPKCYRIITVGQQCPSCDYPRLSTDSVKWEEISSITGPLGRHVEQLWDEVKRLKERVKYLENHELL